MSNQTPNFGAQGSALPHDFAGKYNQLLFVIKQVLNRTSVSAVCQVIAVNVGSTGFAGSVDLQPLVNQVDGFGNAIPQGVLHNVPIFRLQSGVNGILCDPIVGDVGVALFSDRDISALKFEYAAGNIAQVLPTGVNPSTRRRFDLADGLFFGGFLNDNPTSYIQFLNTLIKLVTATVEVDASTAVNITTPKLTLNAQELDLLLTSLLTLNVPTANITATNSTISITNATLDLVTTILNGTTATLNLQTLNLALSAAFNLSCVTASLSASSSCTITSPIINLTSWAGMIAPFAMGSIPGGWLACPTSLTPVLISSYPRLAAALGTTWGGDGVTTFGLPYFPTGYVPIAGSVGVLSHGKVKDHTHTTPWSNANNYTPNAAASVVPGTTATSNPVAPEGGADNLAAGYGVQYCVKY